MPLMFHEKTRRVFAASGGRTAEFATGVIPWVLVSVVDVVLRRFAGGGLMARLMIPSRYTNVYSRRNAFQKSCDVIIHQGFWPIDAARHLSGIIARARVRNGTRQSACFTWPDWAVICHFIHRPLPHLPA